MTSICRPRSISGTNKTARDLQVTKTLISCQSSNKTQVVTPVEVNETLSSDQHNNKPLTLNRQLTNGKHLI